MKEGFNADSAKKSSSMEETLPEVEFKLIGKSKEKIGNKLDIQLIESWNDYTICSLKNNDSVKIFNDKLEVIADKVPKKITVNVRSLYRKVVNNSGADYIYYSDVLNLKEPYKSLFLKNYPDLKQNNKYIYNDTANSYEFLKQQGDLVSLEEGKYIVFRDSPRGWLQIYQTKSDRNITLAPKDWISISMFEEKLPEGIKEKILELSATSEDIKELNKKYQGLITDVGINITDSKDKEGKVLFSELLPSVKENVVTDPTNDNIIYFCQAGTPKDIVRLDMSNDPSTWKTEYAPLKKQYTEIKNLQLDPTGTFFLFYSDKDLVMITKDTFEEVKRIPELSNVNFDSQGRIRAVDKEGYLVLYDVDYASLGTALAKRKAQGLTTGVDIKSIFSQKSKSEKSYDEATIENLEPIKKEWEAEVLPKITSANNIGEVLALRSNLNDLRRVLRSQNLGPEQIQFITEGIEQAISQKEKEYASQEAQKYLSDVETRLAGSLSITTINELRALLDKIKPIEGALDLPERERAHKLTEEVNKRALELFGMEGSKIVEELSNLMEGTKKQLEGLVNKNEFDDWMEFRFPQMKARLGMLLQDCPIEAFEAAAAITKARNDLVQIADTFNKKFQLEYAQVREKAVERTDTIVQTLSGDITSLTERLKSKNFATREEAEQYLATSEAKRVLEDEIQELNKSNPDAAKELERSLKVAVANSFGVIERGGSSLVAETGQQMVLFGEIQFPRFEGKVKEKHAVEVDLTFVLDQQSKGPGINPKNFYGDVELIVINSKGEKRTVRLYEGLENEDEWRLGMLTYRGDAIPPSYLTTENFKAVKQNLIAWESGKLKEKDKSYRDEISKFFETREKIGKRDKAVDASWQESYKAKITEYGKFCAENNILLFRRMDQVEGQNTIDSNGKGYVPKWQNHWVPDPTAEGYLEQMAKHFKMQGDLQEGILNLYGHAGTGKDVLIKMFASKEKANRPYFATDCTKWTTEYELAEDVILEAKDGATQTIRVPSSVLTGIQTPGAIVYFNEVNGMPEQSQIFLHALWDEKRSMTLKTSSGKVVQALPSVLFASSMNPNYPGTFEPQFATKSRMVSIDVDYPPLHRKGKEDEAKGREEPYNASEALRIARGVESLVDFTYELNMDKNEFVKVWDKNVNGINNDAPPITKSQEFDLNVIRGLVQFADKLRTEFKKNFDKTRESRDALPVKQPLTLREMRRCAYALSKMPEAEKLGADSDDIARKLLKEYFLSNIYVTEDKKKIEDSLKVMNSKNRLM